LFASIDASPTQLQRGKDEIDAIQKPMKTVFTHAMKVFLQCKVIHHQPSNESSKNIIIGIKCA